MKRVRIDFNAVLEDGTVSVLLARSSGPLVVGESVAVEDVDGATAEAVVRTMDDWTVTLTVFLDTMTDPHDEAWDLSSTEPELTLVYDRPLRRETV